MKLRMGRRIRYCRVCGERIAERDLETGRAVVSRGESFCPACRDQAPQAEEAMAPQTVSTGPRRVPVGAIVALVAAFAAVLILFGVRSCA